MEEGRNEALKVTKKLPPFFKVPSASCSGSTLDMLHVNIFHNTLVKEPLDHVFILFLQRIWVMVGLEETEAFTAPARFGERVD